MQDSVETAPAKIRRARRDDWPEVASLLAELGRPDVRGRDDEPAARLVFEQYLAREDAVALVAEVDGRVAGFVDMEYRSRLNFTVPQAWVPDLVVAEAWQGCGLGAALLAEAERLARERACFVMSLESADWRAESHAFYLHMGWADSAKSFTKSLSASQWPPPPPMTAPSDETPTMAP